MAEVKIDITAEDRATPVIDAFAQNAGSTLSGLLRQMETLAANAGMAREGVVGVAEDLAKLDTAKVLTLDVSQAIASAAQARAAIDAIPDVTVKTVIVQYQTQASPVMPFTEGIRHIREMMESLPTEGRYTVKATAREDNPRSAGLLSAAGGIGSADGRSKAVTFSPTINIAPSPGTDGRGLAREMDAELARMWRYNRSELRRAISR